MNNNSLFIQLEPKSISACASLPPELAFMSHALQHQVDVFEKSRHCDIILDLAPTGTGKTNAGFTVIFHQPNQSAVYIAPTNALITQQAEAAEKFIKEAGLPHVVKSASAKEIKAWPEDKVGKRSGEKLYNVLRNPATIFPEIGANRPILLVTNPDIFYYATFFAYNKLDRDNIAAGFYTKFGTVIFDEFHLYNAKQLVSLLFYLAYFHVLGFFASGRRVVLLTATPEPACEAALKSLEEQGVKIARIDGENIGSNLLPSQTEINLEIRPQLDRQEWLEEIAQEVAKQLQQKPDLNGAVILDSKDTINRLADLLKNKGLGKDFGRIHGDTPFKDRQLAAQKPIILATSTVDVGFNFERQTESKRQNLDWLIFSARDRFSFWQRIGRVGRVLGKIETNIPSDAIAYLPAKAWEEGISSLDCHGGRQALSRQLENLSCLNRQFLEIYWRSEAFLEIARPLLELEEKLENLPASKFIPELYKAMQLILGGKRDWNYYRYRMKALRGANDIANIALSSLKEKKKWKYIKGGQAFVKTFLQIKYPEHYEGLQAKVTTIEDWEEEFQKYEDAASELKEFAEFWSASYAPIFQFRESLFDSLKIRDPKGLILDDSDETTLDPIHLLRHYEFVENGEFVELASRAETNYDLGFRMRYFGTAEEFKNKELNKLSAFKNCQIERKIKDAIAPTPLLKRLEKNLIPGVIIATAVNQGIIIQLRKQGVSSYPMIVSCNDFERECTFFPNLSGILAIATSGVKLKLPDEENFYIT